MIAVVIPFTPGACRYRDKAFAYVTERLEHHHGWPIVTGTCDGQWSKGRAVADALTRTDADIIVMHDADSFVTPDALEASVAAVEDGVWSMPHTTVHRLKENATNNVYGDGVTATPPDGRGVRLRHPYQGTAGGGVVAITRDDYESCPIDPRFEGWGGEDDAWGRALCTLVGGHIEDAASPFGMHPPHRVDSPLWHLYHPPAPTHRNRGGVLPETNRLVALYKQHTGVPRMMRALIDDAPPADPLPEGPVQFRFARKALRIPAGKIRTLNQLYTTEDPIEIEQLRAHRLAEEVA